MAWGMRRQDKLIHDTWRFMWNESKFIFVFLWRKKRGKYLCLTSHTLYVIAIAFYFVVNH